LGVYRNPAGRFSFLISKLSLEASIGHIIYLQERGRLLQLQQ
jgi:hypothetical protein